MRAALGTALLFVVLVTSSVAAEDVLPLAFEIRLHLGATPGINDTDAGMANGENDQRFGLAYGVQGIVRHRLAPPFGYILATGFFANAHDGELSADNGVTSVYAGTGVEFGVGAFWEINPRVHVELLPLYQVGKGRLTVDNHGNETRGEFGTYATWSIQSGAYYTYPFGLQLGARIGWMDWHGKSSVMDVNTRSKGAGIMPSLVAGYSF
jgi:hypothetical protein